MGKVLPGKNKTNHLHETKLPNLKTKINLSSSRSLQDLICLSFQDIDGDVRTVRASQTTRIR